MVQALYIKELPKSQSKIRRADRLFFFAISLLGLISVIFAVWPYVVWRVSKEPKFTSTIDRIPVPEKQVLSANSAFYDVQIAKDADGFSYFTTDYKPEGVRTSEFYVTIPKLKIKHAAALVDNVRFEKNLSHFPGTAIPGEVGNAFVTGHSVLPQFNDPDNFRTIFTKLSDLEIGDDVYIEVGGQRFHYIVQYAKIVDPRDLSVLAPISSSGRNLTLMTCVPPGMSTKRLIVVTGLI